MELSRLFVVPLALVLTVPAPARADPVPDDDRLKVIRVLAGLDPTSELFYSAMFEFGRFADDGPLPAGTQVSLAVSSRGNLLQTTTAVLNGGPAGLGVWFNPKNKPDMRPNPVSYHVGRSLEYAFDVVPPGYDPYTVTGSYALDGYSTSDGPVVRPTCEVVNGPCLVKKWSKKDQRKTRYGATVSVTRTETLECEVTYTWVANGRTVRSGVARWLVLGKKYRGKHIKLVVTATKNGDTKTRTLAFGKVR